MPAFLTINSETLLWVDKLKYLGIWLCSGKSFTNDLSEMRRKFFTSVNVILSKCKYTSDFIKLQLLESHCLPILLYAAESLDLNATQLKSINSWWNSVYRKIFGYAKWESVRQLICLSGRLDILHLTNLRCITFVKQTVLNGDLNKILGCVITRYVCRSDYKNLLDVFHCQASWSISKTKAMMFFSFRLSCLN